MPVALIADALTNLSDVKESMGIASSDQSWDNLICRKINQVSKQIEQYCGRVFTNTTYTQEEYNSTQVDQIVLRQRPITGTTTFLFEVRDSGLNVSSWETIDPSLYFVDSPSGIVDMLFRATGRWNRWRFTYSAGYTTIPQDLSEAASMLVAYYVLNPSGDQVGIRQKREGSREVMYDTTQKLDFVSVMEQLGVDQIIDSYSNLPINTDK